MTDSKPDRCLHIEPLLSAFLDGELAAVEHTANRCRVEEHLARCVGCRGTARSWQADAGLLGVAQAEVPASPWFAKQVMLRVREEQHAKEQTLGTRLVNWARALPVLVTVAGLLLGMGIRVGIERGLGSHPEIERLASYLTEWTSQASPSPTELAGVEADLLASRGVPVAGAGARVLPLEDVLLGPALPAEASAELDRESQAASSFSRAAPASFRAEGVEGLQSVESLRFATLKVEGKDR